MRKESSINGKQGSGKLLLYSSEQQLFYQKVVDYNYML